MTTPGGNGPASTSAMKRYGPLIGIVVVLAVIAGVVLLSGRDSGTSTQTAAPDSTAGTTPSGSGSGSSTPQLYADAKAAGTEGDVTWVDNCDPETGKIKLPTVYAPPCVPKFTGDNGG